MMQGAVWPRKLRTKGVFWIHSLARCQNGTVDGSEIRRSPVEPRKKPWLVGLYRGLYYPGI